MDLARIVRVMGIYSGRDKFLRAAYAALVFLSTKQNDPEQAKRILAFAKQLSAARLVFRQLNHPQMAAAARDAVAQSSAQKDEIDYTLGSAVTALYSVYGITELVAWLADAKLVVADSAKWYRWCLYLWLTALVCGIVRTARSIARKPWDKSYNDRVTLCGFVCDFTAGANGLPVGWLWSGKLSTRQASTLSFIASVIGFWKLY